VIRTKAVGGGVFLCVWAIERERSWFGALRANRTHSGAPCAWATCPPALHCAPDTTFIVNGASFPEPMLICSIHEMRLMCMCVCDTGLVATVAQSSY
jgi:hypothetical protein